MWIMGKLKTTQTFTIIQLDVNKLTDSLILEKNPILITSKIVDANDVIKTNFKYLYMFKTEIENIQSIYKIHYQYLVIHNNCSYVSELLLEHPKNKRQIMVKLYPYNILIIPMFWKIKINKKIKGIKCYGLDSPFSYCLGFFAGA